MACPFIAGGYGRCQPVGPACILSDMSSQRKRTIPCYQQVANILRAQIMGMEGESPVQLPTERDLCRIHEVSRETVRKAMEVLEADGLIERAPSRGTLTVPAGIRAWRRLRQARLITVATSVGSNPNVPASFYGRIMQGILSRAEQAGYSISFNHMRGHFPPISEDCGPEDPQRVLGAIVAGIQDERVIAMHTQVGYPVVSVDYWSRDPRADVVVVDCFGEGERAAEFLLEQGHRDLFYLGNAHGPQSGRQHEADADLMFAGFARALRRAGVDLPAERILFCRQSSEEVRSAVEQVTALRPRPTAGLVLSSSALRQFRAHLSGVGLSCPQDISLMCKSYVGEDLEAASLRGDADLMGRMAVDLLLERAAGRRCESVCVALRSRLQRGPTVRQISPRA